MFFYLNNYDGDEKTVIANILRFMAAKKRSSCGRAVKMAINLAKDYDIDLFCPPSLMIIGGRWRSLCVAGIADIN